MHDREELDSVLLDLETKSNEDLRHILDGLQQEEDRISYRRRVLHGKIDILRAELVRRLKAQRAAGDDVISGHDVDRLVEILASDFRAGARFDVTVALDGEDDEEDDEKD